MTDWGHYLTSMRANAPLVHNITNYVAMNVMANCLLAAGASPAMVHAREEAAEFAMLASALTINIGTLSPPWVDAMEEAACAAHEAGRPWVLDPVAAGATSYRRAVSARLITHQPTIIRGNASEILALSGAMASGKGVDSNDGVETAKDAALALARALRAVVAVTGEKDFITDGERSYAVSNGHPLMPRVTALGCSLTGIVAAFAVDQPPLEATVAALAYYGLAGEMAAAEADGPGSCASAFVDALYRIQPSDLGAGAKVARA